MTTSPPTRPGYGFNELQAYEQALALNANTHITPLQHPNIPYNFNGPFPIRCDNGKTHARAPIPINQKHIKLGVFLGFDRRDKSNTDPWTWPVVYAIFPKGRRRRLMLQARPYNYVGEPAAVFGNFPNKPRPISWAVVTGTAITHVMSEQARLTYVLAQRRYDSTFHGANGCYEFNGQHRQDLRQSYSLANLPY